MPTTATEEMMRRGTRPPLPFWKNWRWQNKAMARLCWLMAIVQWFFHAVVFRYPANEGAVSLLLSVVCAMTANNLWEQAKEQ